MSKSPITACILIVSTVLLSCLAGCLWSSTGSRLPTQAVRLEPHQLSGKARYSIVLLKSCIVVIGAGLGASP